MTRFGVRILPKKGFLDPQGRAVEALLKTQHAKVYSVQVGKWIEIQIDEVGARAQEQALQMAREVLVNPLTEEFELEEISGGNRG